MVMDELSDDFLTGPALSRDEHGRVGAGDLTSKLDHALEGGRYPE